MYNFIVNFHSILRWALALLFIITIVYAIYGKSKNFAFVKTGKLAFATLNVLHIQFLVGLVLYFISPKVIFSGMAMKAPLTRFFLVEHITAMLIGVVIVTIGYSVAKKALTDEKKYSKIILFYTIGFLIILAGIPWPFYNLGTGWL
jgi:uncharacterized membrane protein AbrB (regulator of aidB expression)